MEETSPSPHHKYQGCFKKIKMIRKKQVGCVKQKTTPSEKKLVVVQNKLNENGEVQPMVSR